MSDIHASRDSFDIVRIAIDSGISVVNSAPLHNCFVRSYGDFGRVSIGITPTEIGSAAPAIGILGLHIGLGTPHVYILLAYIHILFAYINILWIIIDFARSFSVILSTIHLIVRPIMHVVGAAMLSVHAFIHFLQPFMLFVRAIIPIVGNNIVIL